MGRWMLPAEAQDLCANWSSVRPPDRERMHANDRSVVAFTMLAHATFHTYELAIPVFVTVWLDAFGVTEAVLGVVVGAGYALVGFGALPSGLLADAYGSRTLVVASMAGMGVGFLLVSLAGTVGTLALALVVWGPARASIIPRGSRF